MILRRRNRTEEIEGCSGIEARNVGRILDSYATT
jgi:hypothetical protein